MAIEHPLYLLVGSEAVQKRYLLSRLRAQSGQWERVSAKEQEPQQVAQASLLVDPDKPLVRVVEDYEAWSPKQRKEMAAMVDHLGQGLNVLVCAGRLGAKDPLRQAVDEKAIIKLYSPKRGEFTDWLVRQGKMMGTPLDREAADLMVERLGENTEMLAAELARISHLGEVNWQLVERFTPHQAGREAWGWIDSVVDRKPSARLLGDCEASGLEPLMILGALSKRFCLLAWVRLVEQGTVGAKDYPWKLAKRSAGDWPPAELSAALSMIAKAEQKMKGQSQLDGYTQLGRLGLELSQAA